MIRLFQILFIIIIFLSACRDQQGIIVDDEELMINVLIDMYIADVALVKHSTILRDSMRLVYREQIIEIYDLDLNTYDSLYSLVQSDFDHMDKIQLKVLEKLRALNKETDPKTN